MDEPRTDLYRAQPHGLEVRAAEGGPVNGTLVGHFSVFDTWYEVDSSFEGHFLERVAPGAWSDTIANDISRMRVTFNHGQDPVLGDKVLGPIARLEEDAVGARYEVPLFDNVPGLIVDGLRAGVYGSSMRFSVEDEQWDRKPSRSDHNPAALPERTITRASVGEFGPVTFPANAAATAGIRSITDQFRPAPVPEPVVPAPARKETPVDVIETPEPKPALTRAERPARIEALKADAVRFAGEHTGALSREEQGKWDTLEADIRQLEADERADNQRLKFLEDRAAVQANTVDIAAPVTDTQRAWTPTERATVGRGSRVRNIFDLGEIRSASNGHADEMQLRRDCAMRAVEAATYPAIADVPATQAKIQRLIDRHDTHDGELRTRVLMTASPGYEQQFWRYLRTGQPIEERYAPWTSLTDATGGYAVPAFTDPSIIHVGAHTTVNPYRRACRVIPLVGTNEYRGVTSTAVLVARADEAVAVAEGGPATVGQVSAIVTKVHSLVTASMELFSDRPDIGEEFSSLIAEAKDTEEEAIFTTGAGGALGQAFQPIGMLPVTTTTGAYTETETATNNTFAIGDLYTIEAALPIRHRMNAAWFMGRATIRAAQAMETTGGQLFGGQNYASVGYPQLDPFGNTGLRLLNYPVWEVPSAPTGVADNAQILAICDPNSFLVVERIGMTVELIPMRVDGNGLPTGQRGVYAWWRNTCKPNNVDAGRRLRINPA